MLACCLLLKLGRAYQVTCCFMSIFFSLSHQFVFYCTWLRINKKSVAVMLEKPNLIHSSFTHCPAPPPESPLSRRRGKASGAEQHALDPANVVPGLADLVVGFILTTRAGRHAVTAAGGKVHLGEDDAVKLLAEVRDLVLDVLKVAALGDDVVAQARDALGKLGHVGRVLDGRGLGLGGGGGGGGVGVAGERLGKGRLGANVAVEHFRGVLVVVVFLADHGGGGGCGRGEVGARGGGVAARRDDGDGALELVDELLELGGGGVVELLAGAVEALNHGLDDKLAGAVDERRQAGEAVERGEQALGGDEGGRALGLGEELGVCDDGGAVGW